MNEKSLDIIVIARGPFKTPFWHNPQQISFYLAKNNKVLYVEKYYHILHFLKYPGDIQLVLKSPRIEGNVFVLTTFALFPKDDVFEFFKILNKEIVTWQIKRAVKKLNFTEPLLWVYGPNHAYYIGRFHERIVIYHCTDEISSFPFYAKNEKRKRSIIKKESQLLKKANIVFTTAKTLFENKRKINPNTYYVQNVANFDLFHNATMDTLGLPRDIKDIPLPIIGFVGVMNEYKVDFSIVEFIKESHPDWSIVMIGPIEYSENLKQENIPIGKNIYYLGEKKQTDLPNYLRAFDVCIIPNQLNENTRYSFPLKFFEYLASGKPVVTTAMPALSDYRDIAKIANTKEEFVKFISESLTESDELAKQRRMDIAKKNTWEKQVKNMEEIIRERLAKKRA